MVCAVAASFAATVAEAFKYTKFGAKLQSQQCLIGGAIIFTQFFSQLGAVVVAKLWSLVCAKSSSVAVAIIDCAITFRTLILMRLTG
jgi:hypothetical protein